MYRIEAILCEFLLLINKLIVLFISDYEELASGSQPQRGRQYRALSSQPEPSASTTVYVVPPADSDIDNMELRIPVTSNNWGKFRLLMWKNFLLQWRHKTQAIVEILVPVVFSALLVLIRYLVEPTVHAMPTRYAPFAIDTLDIR